MNKGAATNIIAILGVIALVAGAAWFRSQRAEPAVETPAQPASAPTLPRLVDLGADKCIPCKKLAPILEELRKEYQGKLSVEFIDVWKNPKAGEPYKINLIPTQILYDHDGNEVWRHEGFISREDLKTIFAAKVGVD